MTIDWSRGIGPTIGEIIQEVLRIDTPEEAERFYGQYVEHIRKTQEGILDTLPDGFTPPETPEWVARANIGWVYGEGMTTERRAMWYAVTGAEHPVFGLTTPTAEEAFQAGVNLAKRMEGTRR